MKPWSILLVEDSLPALDLIESLLKPLKADITRASDGKEGLQKARDMNFDLIITDVVMPDVDGYKLSRNLKNIRDTRGIPIIMISNFDSEDRIEEGFQSGASAFLSKTEIGEQLLDCVQDTLDKSSFYKDKTILVVDDSMSICHFIEVGLSRTGFKTMTAENGTEALDFMKEKVPDVIVSDVEMPELNGFKLRERLLSHPKYNEIPFIVMSSRGERSYIKRFGNLGASAFLVKPFNIEELVIVIERVLSEQFQIVLRERQNLSLERDHMLASITSLA
jgi:CheY-like chemotaxis protein